MFILEVSRGCPDGKYPLNGIFEFDQARALFEFGHRVVFAAVDVRSIRRWRKWGIYQSEKDGIPVYNFDFPVGAIKGVDSLVQKWGFRLLLRRIKKDIGRPNVVHAHFGDMAACVVDSCLEEKIPYVVTEHSSALNTDAIDEKLRLSLKRTYSNAARVIAVSTGLRDRIKQHTGVDAEVIPNIIDFAVFSPTQGNAGKYTYVSAGNLVPRKGFYTLIGAFARVAAEHEEAHLTIMGGGPEYTTLQNRIAELGIEDKVSLYGAYKRGEFARELAKNRFFVLSSQNETFGVVYAEAMACGLPVIATRCGGPENFVNADNGILVDVDDVDGLYRAMLDIEENAESYDREHISDRVRKIFSYTAVARRLTELFERLIQKN